MTVRTKLESNKMSRGYTLVWSDDAFLIRSACEWNGIVGETRESLTSGQHLLRCWSKRKNGLSVALNEHALIFEAHGVLSYRRPFASDLLFSPA